MSYPLYPWQGEPWRQLMGNAAQLPHALLLTGAAGIGKRRFADRLAASWLCESPDRAIAPCGVCDACRWFAAGNHPDFRVLAPQDPEPEPSEDGKPAKKKSALITVDDIRELGDFVNLSAHRGGARVTLVYPAELMNTAAANAFLKTLEEPPQGARFILVSHQWRRLLPTIRSRCRVFPLPTPVPEQAAQWLGEQGVVNPLLHLAHSGGAPLAALDDASAEWLPWRTKLLDGVANPGSLDVLAIAAEFDRAKVEMTLIVDWLQKWVHDLVGYSMAGKVRYYPDRSEALARLAPRAAQLPRFAERLIEARRLATHPLNARLNIEALLYDYLAALKGAGERR
ncbi:DNA polymerase III subunit delta' [Jeongeupia sp. HS-3]|uniref:DNA polymerase III subunit delta' n=1 Tax=Jeongeupia sp. HS-3 TaxID=1009682 RepID=UPI0018A5E53C|nr:DNA polymerase III subunit delta' [Jeongeupia sp. HS-3]BCL75880.1 DNA polymerase III subunit delta' [Jeongeupia sp. HS-3]